jgi:hypothetical protein
MFHTTLLSLMIPISALPNQPHLTAISILKDGKHGRGGDFDDDPDRCTRRGHQISPEDYEGLEEYLSFHGQVMKKYPPFPSTDAEEEVHPEVKNVWDKNELWNCNFSNKNPGYAFGHLWPCGCEKVRVESEDEGSEEEQRRRGFAMADRSSRDFGSEIEI